LPYVDIEAMILSYSFALALAAQLPAVSWTSDSGHYGKAPLWNWSEDPSSAGELNGEARLSR
jgi:hypothetical protein